MQLAAFTFFLLLLPVSSTEVTPPDDWERVGAAELKVLWFKVYKAELFTATGVYDQPEMPLLLQLTYQRDISKADLIDETEEQLKPFAPGEKVSAWLIQLDQIWPEIRQGDQFSFWVDEQGKGSFFHNQRWIGTLAAPEFSYAFINIWLSEQSNYPELAKKLRGDSRDETIK
ncbi:MAG: chalcone isomerase family protein [Neptuniibacter sp.]